MKRSPMPKPTKPLKRSRMSRKPKRAGEDLARWDREQYRDATGLAFSDLRGHMQAKYGKLVSQWPDVNRQKNPVVLRRMHDWFPSCWNCGFRGSFGGRVEAHHVTKGRSDELTNVCMLCSQFGEGGCHPKANTAGLPKGRILFLIWRENRYFVNWERLCLLNRSFLNELIPD